MPTDPFTQVYDKVLTTLKNHAGVAALVRVRNFIDFSGTDPDPEKDNPTTRDYPEIMLAPGGGDSNLMAASKSNAILMNMDLRIASGDKRIDQAGAMFPLQWQVVKALYALKDGAASGISFLTGLRLLDRTESATEDAQEGWVTLWTVEATLMITNAMMEA